MRSLRSLSVTVAALGATLLAGGLAEAQSRKLTVEDAVQLALDTNPSLQEGRARVESQRALQLSTRGRMLPSVHVNDELQRWNGAYSLPFGGAAFTVRDANTNTFSVSADQPLIGLGHLGHEHDAQTSTADASVAQLEAARADLRAQVETYFVQLFEARALEQIAKASEEELAEQVTIAEARLKAGVLTRADVLRVRVSQANAKEQGIQAHAQGEVARANLIGRMGLPIEDQSIDFAEPATLLAQAKVALPEGQSAQRSAIAQRPEMAQRRLAAESAHHTERARAFGLLPELDAEAAYIRTDGSPFNPANAAYIGLKAQWAIWEWGATYYVRKAALADADAARFAAADEERKISIEVASDLAQATAAVAAVDVAQQTIESAEEAYRVTKVGLQAGTATTTDLLDAQAALTQARLNLTRAQYEDALTRVTLKRGLGTK
jgi:outer membrane protein